MSPALLAAIYRNQIARRQPQRYHHEDGPTPFVLARVTRLDQGLALALSRLDTGEIDEATTVRELVRLLPS